MEYPVLTGFFQSRCAAAAWLALDGAAGLGLPPALPVVELLRRHRVLLVARLRWSRVGGVSAVRPARPWDAALVACSPLAALHVFTNCDRSPSRSRPPRCSRWPGAGRCSPACCWVWAVAAKVYPLILLLRADPRGVRRREPAPGGWPPPLAALANVGGGQRPGRAGLAPENWCQFFWLNSQPARRPGHDLDTSSATSPASRVRRPLVAGAVPTVLNAVVAVVCSGRRGLGLVCSAPRPAAARGSRQLAFLPSPASCCSTRCGARSTRCGSCRSRCWPGRGGGCFWPGRRSTRCVWVPRLLWYLGPDDRGVEVEWFLARAWWSATSPSSC